MADTTYKRLDKDQLIFLVQYLFTKLKNSPLADKTKVTDSIVQGSQDALTSGGMYTYNQNLQQQVDNLMLNLNQTLATKITEVEVNALISSAISGITGFEISVVASLPSSGTKGTIYLVAHSHGTSDAYDEYIWTGSAFEKIGNTDIDLSNYVQSSQLVALTNAEITQIVDESYNTVFTK